MSAHRSSRILSDSTGVFACRGVVTLRADKFGFWTNHSAYLAFDGSPKNRTFESKSLNPASSVGTGELPAIDLIKVRPSTPSSRPLTAPVDMSSTHPPLLRQT